MVHEKTMNDCYKINNERISFRYSCFVLHFQLLFLSSFKHSHIVVQLCSVLFFHFCLQFTLNTIIKKHETKIKSYSKYTTI